jgi:hypothetical protein
MSAAAQLVGTAVGASLIAILLSSAVASANPTPNDHNLEGVMASGQAQSIHPYGQDVKVWVPSATRPHRIRSPLKKCCGGNCPAPGSPSGPPFKRGVGVLPSLSTTTREVPAV